jgi:hypothetical protein
MQLGWRREMMTDAERVPETAEKARWKPEMSSSSGVRPP